jgi:hypothetical protein
MNNSRNACSSADIPRNRGNFSVIAFAGTARAAEFTGGQVAEASDLHSKIASQSSADGEQP